jgi:hypothetical protein
MFGSCRDKSAAAGSGEFLSAMGFGFREGKAQVYAFVITAEGQLRFCEAAAEVMHISMADASEEILFAGEFFIAHEAGRYFVIVSNNSGSYKPDEDRLENTCQLFADILGDVDVEACLPDDPRIKLLTTRHRGDPIHMDHSVHHRAFSKELRSAAQLKSKLIILGRGHEVGVYGYGSVPQPQIRAVTPSPSLRPNGVAGHRRSRTWEVEPRMEEASAQPAVHQNVGHYGTYATAPTANGCTMAKCASQSAMLTAYPSPFAQNIQNAQTSLQKVMSSRQMPGCGPAMPGQAPVQRMTTTCQ